MCPNERPALCVAIHDVAPATWTECRQLLEAVRAVAGIPLSWLVVPRYHGSAVRDPACERGLDGLLAQGHELVLHGYTHRDEAPLHGALLARALRTVYTQGEGEFAAIGESEARRRIDLGLDWFGARGWPVHGFVAPAWLLSPGARAALHGYPFLYTTSYSHFDLLTPVRTLRSPALVYAARNGVGRMLSPPLARLMARALAHAPLVRVALHPRDARHPALLRHAQRLIARLLDTHAPMTKADFARACADSPTSPRRLPYPSGPGHSLSNKPDSPSAPLPPWR